MFFHVLTRWMIFLILMSMASSLYASIEVLCDKVEDGNEVSVSINSELSSYQIKTEHGDFFRGDLSLNSEGYNSISFRGYAWHYIGPRGFFVMYVPGLIEPENGVWEAHGLIGVQENRKLVNEVRVDCQVSINN